MEVYFADMGQGDCIIVQDPDDYAYIVDCGSSGQLFQNNFALARTWLRTAANGEAVDVILTHPDRDHYNQLLKLLAANDTGTEPHVTVGRLYFSLAAADNSPLGNYSQTALGANLGFMGNPEIFEVTINEETQEWKKWTSENNYSSPTEEHPIPPNGLIVWQGTTGENDDIDWDIRIVAGNVPGDTNTSADITNSASLVTVCNIGADRVVLMGDSTLSTMEYLYNHQAGEISQASVFQIPHHGSMSSFPTEDMVNLFDPQAAVISVGLLNDGYNLPRGQVVDRWLTAANLLQGEYTIDYWRAWFEVDGYDDDGDLQHILDVTWQPYQVEHSISGTFHWLEDPEDADPDESDTGFYGFTWNYFLYRDTLDREIVATGIADAPLVYGFTGT